jgi:hypothetical protein
MSDESKENRGEQKPEPNELDENDDVGMEYELDEDQAEQI